MLRCLIRESVNECGGIADFLVGVCPTKTILFNKHGTSEFYDGEGINNNTAITQSCRKG